MYESVHFNYDIWNKVKTSMNTGKSARVNKKNSAGFHYF